MVVRLNILLNKSEMFDIYYFIHNSKTLILRTVGTIVNDNLKK